jgi:hypothetical protein
MESHRGHDNRPGWIRVVERVCSERDKLVLGDALSQRHSQAGDVGLLNRRLSTST